MTARAAIRRDIRALTAMSFAFPTFQGLATTLVPLQMAELGLSKPVIGLVQALPGVTVLVLGAPCAQLANTRWRRAMLLGIFAGACVASLLFGRAQDAVGLVVPQLILGVATSAFYGNMLATVFRLVSGPAQSGFQGRVMAFQGLGYFVGPLLGGYLSAWGYAWGFAPGIVCGLLGMVAVGRLSAAEDIEARPSLGRYLLMAYGRFWRVLTRRPTVVLGVGLVCLNSFQLYVTGGTFFLVYADAVGLTALTAAGLMSGRELVGAFLRFGFGRVSRRFSPLALLVGAVILGAGALSLLPLAGSVAALALVALGLGLAGAFVPPALNMLAGATAAPQEQSFAILCLATGHFLVQTLTAPVVGWGLATAGYGATYPLIGILWVGLALLVWRLGLGIVGRPNQSSD